MPCCLHRNAPAPASSIRMQQFMVPQFIDIEDKIFGPITVRQFIIILVGGALLFIAFKLLTFVVFALSGICILALTIVVAFLKINSMPFHYFLLNLLQTLRRPRLRVWDKTLSAQELRDLLREEPEPPPSVLPTKEFLTTSKLQELALVVNTGGVYRPGS